MTYKTDEGEVIEGASPLELVTALRDGSRFAAHETTDEFMAGFADRMWEYSQREIDATTPDAFITDLVNFGYLTPVQ